MTVSQQPAATLSHLYRTDGSATFSQNGYSIIASVNGPIEVQRRDELPEEAAIDVIVRPAAGVGGTRERHLEALLQSTLRQVILVQNFPRTLIQVTLQIISTPENETSGNKLNQAAINLPILPPLLQACILALLSAAMPLSTTMAATILALSGDTFKQIVENPSLKEIRSASSVHVLAFSSHGDLLVNESEGRFTHAEWVSIHDHAQKICCSQNFVKDEDTMQNDRPEAVEGNIPELYKTVLQEKIADDLHWKG